jgi:hypothetical protein
MDETKHWLTKMAEEADDAGEAHVTLDLATALDLGNELASISATLAGGDLGSLPNDYPTVRMAEDRMRDLAALSQGESS